MKLIDTVKGILLEYSKTMVKRLIDRFKIESQDNEITDEIYLYYIDRFNQIKNSPNISERDILQYSWEELKKVVDHKSDRIKVGKLDDGSNINSDLVYNENINGKVEPVLMGEFFIIGSEEMSTIRARAERKVRNDHLNMSNRLIQLKLYEIDTVSSSTYNTYLNKVSKLYRNYTFQLTKIAIENR